MRDSNNNSNDNSRNTGAYGGQGIKRMRGDDFRNDQGSSHRMKWDSFDDNRNNTNTTPLEGNDVDQRSEYETSEIRLFVLRQFYFRAMTPFTNFSMNETAVLCLTVQNAKYPITLVNFDFATNILFYVNV